MSKVALAPGETLADYAFRVTAEWDEARAWQRAVADGTGYLNQCEGQDGYEVAAPEVIVAAWREAGYRIERAEAERDEAREKWERTIDELGRVIHILARTEDVAEAVNACQPHASDLARKVVTEHDEVVRAWGERHDRALALLRECRQLPYIGLSLRARLDEVLR